jgi:hypothetical protein
MNLLLIFFCGCVKTAAASAAISPQPGLTNAQYGHTLDSATLASESPNPELKETPGTTHHRANLVRSLSFFSSLFLLIQLLSFRLRLISRMFNHSLVQRLPQAMPIPKSVSSSSPTVDPTPRLELSVLYPLFSTNLVFPTSSIKKWRSANQTLNK